MNRDKIVLARHYAFFHKKIFDMTELTPEDLPVLGNGIGRLSNKRLNETSLINSPKNRRSRGCKEKSVVTQKQRFKVNTLIEDGDEEVLNDG